MKRITLLLTTMLLFALSWQGMAQSTIHITTSGGSWTTEKWVNITTGIDGSGTQVWGQGDGTYGNSPGLIDLDVTLAAGTYYVNCYDKYADSWDGTLISVTAYGSVIGDNGEVSPDDGTDGDASSAFGDTQAQELEASFEIIVPNPPACEIPTALNATNITTTSADLNWTASVSGSAADYNWEVQPQGGAQGDATVIASGTGVAGTSVNTGAVLAANTSYDFFVQTSCGVDGTSSWAGPVSFATPCAAMALPWSEDFENAGTIPNCWSENGGESWMFSNSGTGHIGNAGTITGNSASDGYFAWIDDSGDDSPSTLTSPFVDISTLASPMLSFYELSDNEGDANATLDVEVWDGAAWNNVGSFNTNTGGWLKQDISLAGLTFTGNAQVRFTITDSGSFYDDIALDDITFIEAPSCLPPTALNVTNIADNNADLNWTASSTGTAADYNWEVQPQGGAQGDATMVANGTGVAGTTVNTGNVLTASTSYDFFVQTNCGVDGPSTWAGPFTFSTIPVNDTCMTAIDIMPSTTCTLMTYTNVGATDSGVADPSCSSYGGGDIWFSFTAPATGHVLIDTQAGDITDSGMALYSGTCGSLVEVECDDDGGTSFMSQIDNATLNAGEVYYVRMFEYGGNTFGTFDLCIQELPRDCSVSITPYYLDDFSMFLSDCWSESNGGVTAPANTNNSGWKDYGFGNIGNSGAAMINMYNGDDRDWLISPTFDLSAGNYQLSVDLAVTHWRHSAPETMGNDDEVVLKYTEDGGATWSDLNVWNKNNQPSFTGTNAVIDLSAITGAAVKFAFWANEGQDDRHSYLFFVDNFMIKQATCNAPTSLLVTNASAGSADFSWTDNNAATLVTLEYREKLTSMWNSVSIPNGDTTFTLSGLTSNVEYEWRLLYTCNDAQAGFAVNGKNFIEDCSVIVPDYLQDFASYLPSCWREGDGGINSPANFNNSGWRNSGFARVGSTGAAAFNYYNGNDRDWLISPTFDLSGGTYELTLDVAVSHWQHAGPPTNPMSSDDEMILKYSIDGGNVWTDLMVWNAGNQPSATGDSIAIDLAGSGITSNNVMFAFWANEGQDDRNSYVFSIDNFDIHLGNPSQFSKSSINSTADVKIGQKENIFTVMADNNDNISSIYVYDITGKMIYNQTGIHSNMQDVLLNVKKGTFLIFRIGVNNDTEFINKKTFLLNR